MKKLIFKKLWLVSDSERAAYKVDFHPLRTLLVGRNHTGKSTVVKSLFHVLGCEVKGRGNRWDNLAIAVLEFSLDDKLFFVYRKSNVFAIRDVSLDKLFVTTKYSDWVQILADLFDFHLMLPTHQETLAQATPSYLFLPFYMDQDGSWLLQWNSFDKLTQFSNWKKPVTAYFTGQRPNEYYVGKFEESKAKALVGQIRREIEVTKSALSRVKKALPRRVICVDQKIFRREIRELVDMSVHLKNTQEILRRDMFDLASQKTSLINQINVARDVLSELEGDLRYLTDVETDAVVSCPTCGTEHEGGFPVRLEIIDDAKTVRLIIEDLEAEKRRVDEFQAVNQVKIFEAKRKIAEIEGVLQVKKRGVSLSDVVDSRSADVVHSVFYNDISTLKNNLEKQERVVVEMKIKTEEFNSPLRVKSINSHYSEKVEFFASELGVQDLKDLVRKKPEGAIDASGSALPRSLLAYQYAILYTAIQANDAKIFPVVIDSPNQQGQDPLHLIQMLEFIVRRTPLAHQLILAIEDMPEDFIFHEQG